MFYYIKFVKKSKRKPNKRSEIT